MARPIAWLLPALVAGFPLAAAARRVRRPADGDRGDQGGLRPGREPRHRAGARPHRRHRRGHRGRARASRSRPARSSRPSSTTRLALQRDAADAEIKALQSQLENARTELDRGQQLLAKGAATAEPRRSGSDRGRRAHQPARRGRGPACRDRAAGDRGRGACSRCRPRAVGAGDARARSSWPAKSIVRIAGGGYFLRLALPERHAAEIQEGDTVSVGRRVLSPAGGADTAQVAGAAGQGLSGDRRRPRPRRRRGRRPRRLFRRRADAGLDAGRRAHACSRCPPRRSAPVHGIDYVRVAGATRGPIDVAVVLGETFAGDGRRPCRDPDRPRATATS